MRWPNLARTAAAIAAHDAAYDRLMAGAEPADLAELERLEQAVGTAFAQETADRNDPKFVERVIRPGPPTTPPGEEPSFVRRCVAGWRAERIATGADVVPCESWGCDRPATTFGVCDGCLGDRSRVKFGTEAPKQ